MSKNVFLKKEKRFILSTEAFQFYAYVYIMSKQANTQNILDFCTWKTSSMGIGSTNTDQEPIFHLVKKKMS